MKILIIRRDNIGDLVCTTPMIRLLRRRFPDAHIDALVTDYNAAVLAGNPDLDRVFTYRKAKHRAPGVSRLGIYWQRLRQAAELRRRRYDLVLLPAGGPQRSAQRLARWLGAARVLTQDLVSPMGGHEVERCAHLLTALDIDTAAPAAVLVAPEPARQDIAGRLATGEGPLIAIHISSRKPSQRWPVQAFVELMHALHIGHGARFLLLWSPGGDDNPLHPGDDAKAREIVAACPDLPLLALPTEKLETLIAALSLVDTVVCSDGGAMHLAAGLGKPIVCFFGQSDPERWHPWAVPYRLLQAASRQAADITVADALRAYEELADTRLPTGSAGN